MTHKCSTTKIIRTETETEINNNKNSNNQCVEWPVIVLENNIIKRKLNKRKEMKTKYNKILYLIFTLHLHGKFI